MLQLKRLSIMSILLIGSTGFLGKSVLETLLRESYPGIIYLLIRSKRGKSVQERFQILVNNNCFVNHHLMDLLDKKIILIEGDLQDVNLTIEKKFDVIINCAAAISFTLPLSEALKSNTSIIHNLKRIAKETECSKLIQISTAYVAHPSPNNDRIVSKEELIDLNLRNFNCDTADELYNAILDGHIDFDQIQTATGYPNTYTFTKSLAEHILLNGQIFPEDKCFIIRPSVITGSYQYPFEGWTEGVTSANGYFALFMGRYISVISSSPEIPKLMNLVPVDIVSDCIYKCIIGLNNQQIKYSVNDEVIDTQHFVDYIRRINSLYHDSVYYNYFIFLNYYLYNLFLAMFDLSRLFIQLLLVKFLGLFSDAMRRNERTLSNIIKGVVHLRYNYHYFLHNRMFFDTDNSESLKDFKMNRYIYVFVQGINEHLLKKKQQMNLLQRNNGFISYIRKISLQIHFGIFHFTNLFTPIFKFLLSRCYNSITVKYTDAYNVVDDWNEQYVIVTNHRSHMDSVIIKYFLDANPGLLIKNPYILAGKEFQNIPVLSRLIRWTKVIFIDRRNPDKKKLEEDIESIMSKGENLLFYPEGTRSRYNKVAPFKRGVFSVLHNYVAREEKKNISVLPISISYQMIPEYESFKKEISGQIEGSSFSTKDTLKWTCKTLIQGRKYGDVQIVVGTPLKINEYSLDDLISHSEKQIASNFHRQEPSLDHPDELDKTMWCRKKID